MKKIILISLALVFLGSFQLMAEDNSGFGQSWDQQDTFMRPYEQDAYGPGIHSDATGRSFVWQTDDGQTVLPGDWVQPDGYGLGIGMDEFGRPVKPKIWP